MLYNKRFSASVQEEGGGGGEGWPFTLDKSFATLNRILASSSAARCFSVGNASTNSSLLSRE